MLINGLQTKGIFAVYCTIEPEQILCSLLWLRDWSLLGTEVSLVDSEGDTRYRVQMPAEPLPFPTEDVVLKRCEKNEE